MGFVSLARRNRPAWTVAGAAGPLPVTVALLLLSLSLLEGAEAARVPTGGKQHVDSLVAALKRAGKFQHSLYLMQRSDIPQSSFVSFLQQILGVHSATIFLPTDAAWAKLPFAVRQRLNSGDVRGVVAMLKFHTIKSTFRASRLVRFRPGTTFLSTLGDLLEKRVPPANDKSRILIGPPSRKPSKNYASVMAKDRYVNSAVVVHGIDTFLIPPNWS